MIIFQFELDLIKINKNPHIKWRENINYSTHLEARARHTRLSQTAWWSCRGGGGSASPWRRTARTRPWCCPDPTSCWSSAPWLSGSETRPGTKIECVLCLNDSWMINDDGNVIWTRICSWGHWFDGSAPDLGQLSRVASSNWLGWHFGIQSSIRPGTTSNTRTDLDSVLGKVCLEAEHFTGVDVRVMRVLDNIIQTFLWWFDLIKLPWMPSPTLLVGTMWISSCGASSSFSSFQGLLRKVLTCRGHLNINSYIFIKLFSFSWLL